MHLLVDALVAFQAVAIVAKVQQESVEKSRKIAR